MPERDVSIFKQFQHANPDLNFWPIHAWIDLMYQPDHAYRISFAYRHWLESERSEPAPDLAEYIAIYGYIRLRLKNWELPIELTPEEMQRWREGGYYVTLEDFYEPVARVAGGFLKTAGTVPELTAQIVQAKLDEKLAELERLLALPIDSYTPKEQEWQVIEELRAENVSEERFKLAMEDVRSEAAHDFFEVPRFDKPFKIRDELESFVWGMEMLRMIVLGENSPELGLPNRKLFGALLQIDLNALNARLLNIDDKLRVIWRNLADYDCYCINAEHEPEQFWWRHYPPAKTNRRTRAKSPKSKSE